MNCNLLKLPLLNLVMLLAVLLPLHSAHAAALDQSHAAFTAVLAKHVHWNPAGTASSVDYAGLAANRAPLDAYTQSLSGVTEAALKSYSKAQRRAFLINAYNAFTLQLILTQYPKLNSIKELGSLFRSPWKKAFIKLLGKEVSLDDIEQTMIRAAPDFDDPRIHFAVNCASIGCPALRPEAFVAAKLEAQLLDQTQRFLRDRSRNAYQAKSGVLMLSSIFDWYGDDFVKHSKSVSAFLSNYAASLGLKDAELAKLKSEQIEIDFFDYDWSLNAKR